MLIVPATVPLWNASGAVAVVVPGRIEKFAVVPPVANCIVPSPPPTSGEKLRIAWPDSGTGKGAESPICKLYCFIGWTAAGRPVMLTDGTVGRFMLMRNWSTADKRALSMTRTAKENVPAAATEPEMTPVLGSMLRPSGKPLAVHVYGGTPPLA